MNPPDFKFYVYKLTNKKFPVWYNVNFGPVFFAYFILFIAVKIDSKLILHHMGKIVIS